MAESRSSYIARVRQGEPVPERLGPGDAQCAPAVASLPVAVGFVSQLELTIKSALHAAD